jgi:hypothetical protein
MIQIPMKTSIAGLITIIALSGCAGSPLGNTVQRSLKADPQLTDNLPFDGVSSPEPVSNEPTLPASPSASEVEPTSPEAEGPSPGEPNFVGPLPQLRSSETPKDEQTSANASVDLTDVPEDLRKYIQDLSQLNVLEMSQPATPPPSNPTSPSPEPVSPPPAAVSPFMQLISRREYARWLFATYNTLYADESGNRLRPGSSIVEPAFKDVPATDPDFAEIQGLAEAGIIPSAWTGNSTAVNFRPDAPLSREDLILWKVPLDTRAALPKTTPETVTEAWGFQDAATIEPLALRAIAADFQLGDFSNIRRAFGYTTLFRPDKPVTRAEAAGVLWRFGTQTDGRSAAEVVAGEQSASTPAPTTETPTSPVPEPE